MTEKEVLKTLKSMGTAYIPKARARQAKRAAKA
jgi:hypothetical protein